MRFCTAVGQASSQTARGIGPSTMDRSRTGLAVRLLATLGVEAPRPRECRKDSEHAQQARGPGGPLRDDVWCGHVVTSVKSPQSSSVRGLAPQPATALEQARVSHARHVLGERSRGTTPAKLGPERWLDALPGLVRGPEIVAERLDHVIGCYADVRGSLLDHLQH